MATGRVPTTANSPLTAKGDLFGYSTTQARVAVGNDGETLVADSSATVGLRYSATPSASNPILNGAYDIWQRGTSVVGAGGGAYTTDRWMLYAGGQGTVSRQVTNDTTNLPAIQYCARVQRNNASADTTVIPFGQSLESSNSIPFAGKTVTLSFYARKGANYSSASDALSVTLATGTGTDQNFLSAGYTGSATPISQTATLTATWQRFSYSATLATTMTEMAVRFQFTPVGTAGAADFFEVTGVQVDVGSVALPFRRAMNTLQGELAACQRYYWRSTPGGAYNAYGNGGTISTTGAYLAIPFPVFMRTNATSIDFANLAVQTSGGVLAGLSTLTIDQGSPINISLAAVTASTWTANQPCRLINNNNSAGYLGFSAEL